MTLVRGAAGVGGGGGGNTSQDIVQDLWERHKILLITLNSKESVHWSVISSQIFTPTLYKYLSSFKILSSWPLGSGVRGG